MVASVPGCRRLYAGAVVILRSFAMTFAVATLKASGAVAVMCVVLAASTIWLVLSDPVAVATAVNTGDLAPIYTFITHALTHAFQAVLRYL
jgi:hypothetical protein